RATEQLADVPPEDCHHSDGGDGDERDDDQVFAQALAGLRAEQVADESAHARSLVRLVSVPPKQRRCIGRRSDVRAHKWRWPRPMVRAGQPFAAQLLLRGVNGGAVALVRDLTAGHQQADAALRAEDLARFASLVAHEIRNPLSAVKIALQTLERHGTLAQNDL